MRVVNSYDDCKFCEMKCRGGNLLEGITMPFSLKPDYEKTKARYDAFWQREIIDRPPVWIGFSAKEQKPVPVKDYPNFRERWLDIDFRVEREVAMLYNREFYADSLPIIWPNMGPGIFSAWCGCGYEFGDKTAWSIPCIENWENDSSKAVFNENNPLFKTMVEFTKRLLEAGRGNFITGLTDFHPGGDHIAALRGTQSLAVDLLEHPDAVKSMLSRSYKDYYKAYDIFYDMLRKENLPVTAWMPLIYEGRYNVPCCDFSCMISSHMFEEFFMPGIIEECRFYDRSIYHLDGPGALRHLDLILDIKELDAVQWNTITGNDSFATWAEVYKRIQDAGKAMQLNCSIDELPMVMETLKPEGVWFSRITGIRDRETADRVLRTIEHWG